MSDAPKILFLDISKTCTGIADGRAGEVPKFYSIKGNDVDTTAAMMRLGQWLIERTKVDKPDWLFFEAPMNIFPGEYDPESGKVKSKTNPTTTVTLAKMVGVVEFVAGMKGIATRTAHVQSIRSKFLGHGRPSDPKKRVMAMCRALGWAPTNLDEADAGAGWWWSCMTVAPRFYTPITPMLQAKIKSQFDVAEAAKTERSRKNG